MRYHSPKRVECEDPFSLQVKDQTNIITQMQREKDNLESQDPQSRTKDEVADLTKLLQVGNIDALQQWCDFVRAFTKIDVCESF